MARGGRGWLLLVGALLLLHFALRPVLVGRPAAPDLLTGALLLAALRLRPAGSAGLGCAFGLLEGAMALGGLGISMVAYTLAGYGAARSRELVFTDARIFVPVYLFAGTWLVQAGLALAYGAASPEAVLLWSPVSALLTSAVCWTGLRLLGTYPY